METLRIDANAIDYILVALYFVLVIAIGLMSRRKVSSSLDFLLAGRSLPAWITGLAFISANLGATELLGQSANGAQYGEQAFHYYWIGAVPAMVFLALFMMPFYYGSKVRSVPEFLHRRFNRTTQRLQALLFAVATVLIAGVNLYALALVVNALLGWPIWVSIVAAAFVVLAYTFLGGLSAAIYNEVLQFFVIVVAMIPVTIVGLHRVGGWNGLTAKIAPLPHGADNLSPFPAQQLTGFDSPILSVIGVVFGLGFVLSFGYWTTNFTEVQRAFSANSAGAAQRTPLIAAIPKALVALVIIIPGMIAAVLIPSINELKRGLPSDVAYNDVVPLMLRELLPNGFLGVALTGLLASFMAGMAANVSSFNTIFTYDIWQDWLRPGKPDWYYLNVGRIVTVAATLMAIGTAFIAAGFSNIMDYIQSLFSFFNVPLFATFILGLYWKRMTGTAGWTSLAAGVIGAVGVYILNTVGVLNLPGQGASFLGASVGFVLAIIVGVVVSYRTTPKPEAELVGLVRSLTPTKSLAAAVEPGWYKSPVVLTVIIGILTVGGYVFFTIV
ncbi:sodium/solute symporter [Microlunatus elymi]|uniref:Sodium/solute symporter n=2 Tax=Microlunatus elymi TaxID=2596828 RepID=A0A516Q5G2_9ACTN|nr:sodium/solute symporter [Microlunatus elymi]